MFLLLPSGVLVAPAAQGGLVHKGKQPVTLSAQVAKDVLGHAAICGQLLDVMPRFGKKNTVGKRHVGPVVALYQSEEVSHTCCGHAASHYLVYNLGSKCPASLEVFPLDRDITTDNHSTRVIRLCIRLIRNL